MQLKTYLHSACDQKTFVAVSNDIAIANEEKTKVHFSDNTSAVNQQTKAIYNLNDSKFFIECAVAGGNLYREILGDPQPIFYSCQGEDGNYHRVSHFVESMINWSQAVSVDENQNEISILDCKLNKGTQTANREDKNNRN